MGQLALANRELFGRIEKLEHRLLPLSATFYPTGAGTFHVPSAGAYVTRSIRAAVAGPSAMRCQLRHAEHACSLNTLHATRRIYQKPLLYRGPRLMLPCRRTNVPGALATRIARM